MTSSEFIHRVIRPKLSNSNAPSPHPAILIHIARSLTQPDLPPANIGSVVDVLTSINTFHSFSIKHCETALKRDQKLVSEGKTSESLTDSERDVLQKHLGSSKTVYETYIQLLGSYCTLVSVAISRSRTPD